MDYAATLLSAPISILPPWLVSLAAFACAIALALFAHRMAFAIVTRLVAGMDLFWRSLVSRTHGPTRFAVITVALAFAASISPLTVGQATLIRQLLLLCFIALVGWIAKTALHIWTTVYLRRFKLDADDNLLARKHVTQTRILRRVGDFMIVIVGFSAMLMTFDGVRQYGVSLLASAGAAGLVVGLALQPVLKNIFAGIQLAVTQPIRIDDALLVEGEWGNVEEITSTYVVVRLWDWRRLILPLSYFIEKPFQNWTRDNAALIGTVMLYLDYETPIDAVRAKVEEIAARLAALGQARRQCPGHGFPAIDHGGPHPGQRRHLAARLRSALRGAREADRLPPARASQFAAAPAVRTPATGDEHALAGGAGEARGDGGRVTRGRLVGVVRRAIVG